jgi:two-component system response regulator
MKNPGRAYKVTDILLVEDSAKDIRLVQDAFYYADSLIRLYVVQDGAEAMAFLRNEGNYAHVPRPNVVLLDLNLPKIDRYGVQSEIKGGDNLKSIPTVVLTAPLSEADIVKSYELHCVSAEVGGWWPYEQGNAEVSL